MLSILIIRSGCWLTGLRRQGNRPCGSISPGPGISWARPNGECGVAWLRSVQNGVDWLRAATGAQRIVLCGLRIGATLAALAAEHRNDIAGLILLAPVLRGHSYIQQLREEPQLHRGPSRSRSDGLDFQELRLSPKAVAL